MRLQGITKHYGRQRAVLTDVDLDLPPAQITAITGNNGSGKSTLLRILVGATRPTTGTVTDRPDRVGYVPERFPSDERLSARTYLVHMGRIRKLSTKDAKSRADDVLDRLALAGGAETPLRQLSKGNLQKVAIAQAVLVPPGLLVLDEPWSGLDVAAHGVLRDIVAEVAADDGIVVFTEHRGSVVREYADVVHTCVEGRLVRAPDTEPVTRLVLRPPAGVTGAPALALSARRHGDAVVVLAPSADTDRLLLTALGEGWSVVRVDEAGTR
ncbi:ABC transporter ATP-binding protein [Actinokineospora sp. NBRC 105648]|uniref:ATP-binding cassette domain-containing protein n=1 Tax=Actinokineospora sp. NBRC 105648 TaxID=3032206 RepID=UPI002554DE0A|nr:ABC transporter ATP-binding protein [Actinokineospora sp. NBRC 105648]